MLVDDSNRDAVWDMLVGPDRWLVTAEKEGIPFRCMMERNPVRFKCGHCFRGVVLVFDKQGTFKAKKRCKVCRASIKVTYVVPWKNIDRGGP